MTSQSLATTRSLATKKRRREELWLRMNINQSSEDVYCSRCSNLMVHRSPESYMHRWGRGWDEWDLRRRGKFGVITSDYYRCPNCNSQTTIHIKECQTCGRRLRTKNLSYTRRCYRCKPETEKRHYPNTPKEILDEIHKKEDKLRKEYQQENYMTLGDGVMRDEARDMFEILHGQQSVDDAQYEINHYLLRKDSVEPEVLPSRRKSRVHKDDGGEE